MQIPATLTVELTPDELRFLVACGAALLQNIPENSLPTYTGFDKKQIVDFSVRMRAELDHAGLDM